MTSNGKKGQLTNGSDDQEEENDYFDAENTELKSLKDDGGKRSRPVKSSRVNFSSESQSEERQGYCPDYFGVKSYLHHFYDTPTTQSEIYEELPQNDDFRYLVNPKTRCFGSKTSFWWKLCIWGGINLVVLGTIAVLVGYLVPKKEIVVGQQDDLEIIDRGAVKFNANLDLCKLVGLVIFSVGGAVLATALLFPSLPLTHDEPFGLSLTELTPRNPTDLKIPITEKMTRIQPEFVP